MALKESIHIGTGAAAQAIASDPVVSTFVGGKLGKLMKCTAAGAFIAASMLLASGSAMAENPINGGCVIGAIAGGVLGNQVGGGDGRTAMTAIGSVLGCKVGQDVQANSDYRRQQQQGQAVGVPAYGYGNQYPAPVVGVHPMGNYMPNTFGQINGQVAPTAPLPRQAVMAMDKAMSEVELRAQQNNDAQQQYARAYQQLQQARQSRMNPEAQVLMGTQGLRNNEYQYENQLNQASQARNNTNVNFGSAGMRMADLVEYEAAQGYDIRPYADRIMSVLSTPMSSPVTGVSPASNQQVTFATSNMQTPPPPPHRYR
jgi:uncharacterized protein YcfJ